MSDFPSVNDRVMLVRKRTAETVSELSLARPARRQRLEYGNSNEAIFWRNMEDLGYLQNSHTSISDASRTHCQELLAMRHSATPLAYDPDNRTAPMTESKAAI